MFVELALGSAVIMATFTGTFEFGYTFYQYNALATAVNDGARFASLLPYDSDTATMSSTYSDAIKNMVVYGNPTGGTSALVPGLTTAHVTVSVTFANSAPSKVTVGITGYTLNSVFGSMNCTGKPSFTYPYSGIYQPY